MRQMTAMMSSLTQYLPVLVSLSDKLLHTLGLCIGG